MRDVRCNKIAIAPLVIALGMLTAPCLVASAQAATLTETSGTVLVNVGDGFKAATPTQDLPVGTRVMARTDGQAKVGYSDGCTVNVQPGRVYIVTPQPPCGLTPTGTEGAAGATTAGEYAVGATAIAGIGVAGYALSKKHAASP